VRASKPTGGCSEDNIISMAIAIHTGKTAKLDYAHRDISHKTWIHSVSGRFSNVIRSGRASHLGRQEAPVWATTRREAHRPTLALRMSIGLLMKIMKTEALMVVLPCLILSDK
jgi:hypothetical protein